ncbi:MAG TPA: hypothetical protein VK325_03380 [Pseudoxanthomonas sp.]|nr:hypothetical protein [Pseudoxanthomonas sp.]
MFTAAPNSIGVQLRPPSRVSNPPLAVPTHPISGVAKPTPNSRAPPSSTSGSSVQVLPPSVVLAMRCCDAAGSPL